MQAAGGVFDTEKGICREVWKAACRNQATAFLSLRLDSRKKVARAACVASFSGRL